MGPISPRAILGLPQMKKSRLWLVAVTTMLLSPLYPCFRDGDVDNFVDHVSVKAFLVGHSSSILGRLDGNLLVCDESSDEDSECVCTSNTTILAMVDPGAASSAVAIDSRTYMCNLGLLSSFHYWVGAVGVAVPAGEVCV